MATRGQQQRYLFAVLAAQVLEPVHDKALLLGLRGRGGEDQQDQQDELLAPPGITI